MVEVRAQLKHLRMSPKKVRLVTDAIKGMGAKEALVRLSFMPKIAAQPVAKLLQSAMANAEHNNSLKADDLMVKNVLVNQAVALKRWRPAAFGSAHAFKKHGTHIDLWLTLKPSVATAQTVKKEKGVTTKEAASEKSVTKTDVTKPRRASKKPAAGTKGSK